VHSLSVARARLPARLPAAFSSPDRDTCHAQNVNNFPHLERRMNEIGEPRMEKFWSEVSSERAHGVLAATV
jgi:hypothetical protein